MSYTEGVTIQRFYVSVLSCTRRGYITTVATCYLCQSENRIKGHHSCFLLLWWFSPTIFFICSQHLSAFSISGQVIRKFWLSKDLIWSPSVKDPFCGKYDFILNSFPLQILNLLFLLPDLSKNPFSFETFSVKIGNVKEEVSGRKVWKEGWSLMRVCVCAWGGCFVRVSTALAWAKDCKMQ